MSRQNRATLHSFFEPGTRPTRQQFRDLIDSSLIMDDEGFSKTPSDGLKVATIQNQLGLMSFQHQTASEVAWSLSFLDQSGAQLALKPSAAKSANVPPLVVFEAPDRDAGPDARGRVRVNADLGVGLDAPPAFALDVGGTICSDGRVGRAWAPVKADGEFHPITPILSGCVAFEVMAGVMGVKSSGRFALLHAIAMNANNPIWWDDIFGWRRKIRSQHAYYSRRSDRLQLSWSKKEDRKAESRDPNEVHGMDARFTLNIRTRSTYLDDDPNIVIRAFVTRLWPDPASLARSRPAGEPKA